ncbi:MAG: prephenate dehydratase [bacterium]
MKDRLEELRKKIDDVDKNIVKNLDERAEVAREIGELKKNLGMELYAPGRERQVIKRLTNLGRGKFPVKSLRQIYREIIATCLNLEKPVKVAYLGPEATFTHAAALRQFGRSSNFSAYDSVSSVFAAVERDEADFGVVPVESSREGAVRHTLDRFLESNLSICNECYLMVNLYLMGVADELEKIETVYSHPQALSQARNWLEYHLPSVGIKNTDSTASAARLAAEDPTAAAVASEAAAELYDLNILAGKIENSADNYTRFLVIGKQTPDVTGDDKTSIAFSLQDRAGALYEMLKPFGKIGVNMTKIESRPSKSRTWDYIFFVDFLGHQENKNVKKLLNELRTKSPFFKILGSYPKENPFND